MIQFKHKGDFEKTLTFFKKVGNGDYMKALSMYGERGVEALEKATPKRTGKTAASWSYSIEKEKNGLVLSWNNSNVYKGISIALLIQNGHGTSSGYYVKGVDYINPALKPIFEEIAKHAWEEVSKNA